MKNKKFVLPALVLFGIFFQYLFYSHDMGLNTLLFTCSFTFLGIFFNKKPLTKTAFVLLIGFWIITFAVVFAHTSFSKTLYWIYFLFYAGVAVYPSLHKLFLAPVFALNSLYFFSGTLAELFKNTFKFNEIIKIKFWFKFAILPLLVIPVLLMLYANANSYFEADLTKVLVFISNIMEHISFSRLFFTLFGIGLGLFVLIDVYDPKLLELDQTKSIVFERIKTLRKRKIGLSRILLRKKQVGIIFFVLLNAMILWLNLLDIKYIWLNFEWNGGFLKDMVHEGTYLLIIALLISVAVAIFYLNTNIVFFKNNQFFMGLIVFWLIQNLVMIVSVALRNTYYIHYFALAHKRIFVYFFLLACIVAILTIIYKAISFKNIFYLMKVNSFSVYVILLVSACFNWDVIIAKYNFSHYKSAFVHYSYLVELNDSALPYLVSDFEQIKAIDSAQVSQFKFSKSEEYKRTNYFLRLENRKKFFKEVWNEKTWLDWNYAEANAIKMLN